MVCLHYCVFLRCHTTTLPWFLLEKHCCVTFQTKLAAQETMKETIDSEVWFLDNSTTLQFHELNPNKLFSPLFNKNYRVCKAYKGFCQLSFRVCQYPFISGVERVAVEVKRPAHECNTMTLLSLKPEHF